jgi:cytochrome oxidase Cu insertion factor (SCO1/SenC/PrrC family)
MEELDVSRDREPDPGTDSRLDAAKVDRAASFAAGPGGIPRKVLAIFAAVLVAFVVIGVVADHFLSGPAGSSAPASAGTAYPPPLQSATTAPGDTTGASGPPQLPSSLSALMGLVRTAQGTAPGFSLNDQYGHTVSLTGLRGKVVVLSFFDAGCDDICTVLETELVQAYGDLGSDAAAVVVLTVNTDPLELTVGPTTPVETATGISSLPDWHFLTGTLRQLDEVWKSYGVTVEVQPETRVVSHNDVLYFIDRSGRLRVRATPFANERASGVFSLPQATEGAWATGIADQVRSLLPDTP